MLRLQQAVAGGIVALVLLLVLALTGQLARKDRPHGPGPAKRAVK